MKDNLETRQFHKLFSDIKDDVRQNGSHVEQCWLSYIDMVDVLLNTLYAVRTGSWCLLLECIREIAVYAFSIGLRTLFFFRKNGRNSN